MKIRISLCVAVLAAAVAMGIVGDGLIRGVPPGLGWTLWGLMLLGLCGVFAETFNDASGSKVWPWLVLALVPVLMLAVRDAPLLKLMNLAAVAGCVVLAVSATRGARVLRMGVVAHGRAIVDAGIGMAWEPIRLFATRLPNEPAFRNASLHPLHGIFRGAVVAAPFLLIFGMLFFHADAAFASLIETVFEVGPETWFEHVLLMVFLAVFTCSVLLLVAEGGAIRVNGLSQEEEMKLGYVEVITVLSLINGLFLLFVLVQLQYFFGGVDHVFDPTGPSFSEYARRGFFELCTVAALVLPTLMGFEWLLRDGTAGARRTFAGLSLALIGLVAIIMGSALHRMLLYQSAYGLTELRVYTVAFIGWLVLVFAWFGVTVLRGERETFPIGAIVAALTTLLALNALNPDALIVRANLARLAEGKDFDADYVTRLSADSVPTLAASRELLPTAARVKVDADLMQLREDLAGGDWRTWSWSRSRAGAALDRMAASDAPPVQP